jgi:metal-sulfur cluster biosynthetic enzyme
MDPADRIVEALGQVYDPCCAEREISVVDMGLLRGIAVDEGRARVELILTSGWCPFVLDLLSSIKERIEQLPEVEGAEVDVTWEEAWSAERMSESARTKLRFLPDPKTYLAMKEAGHDR